MPVDSLSIIKAHLEESIGDIGIRIYQKSASKLNIREDPSKGDLEKMVSSIKDMIVPIYGNEKSRAVIEGLNKKLADADKTEMSSNISEEIDLFLAKNALPTEADITDYTKHLAMKYGKNAASVEKDLIEKVKIHVKNELNMRKISEEVGNFLMRYPEPGPKDIEDLITYLRLSKISFKEDEVREQVERERLYRKFHGDMYMPEASALDNFIKFAKTSNDKGAIGEQMQKQGLSYLVKDDKGISDKSLSEFIQLMVPNESDMKDALAGMGLEHMIKKK